MNEDWMEVHHEALQIVDRDIGIKYFRCCNIPGARKMVANSEYYQLFFGFCVQVILHFDRVIST